MRQTIPLMACLLYKCWKEQINHESIHKLTILLLSIDADVSNQMFRRLQIKKRTIVMNLCHL